MSKNEQAISLLQQAFDALEAVSDSDIDMFDDEEEEAQVVPEQYACRKIAEAMELLRLPPCLCYTEEAAEVGKTYATFEER